MKKFISLLIAVVMFPMTVFASAADNLVAVLDANRYIMSAQVNATSSTELNRPIEIVQCLPEFAMGDVDIDLALISESLLQATSSASVTYNMSDDFKKLDMEADVTPDRISFSFEFVEAESFYVKDNTAKLHSVLEGETLFDIAYDFGVPVDSLVKLNPSVRRPDELMVGEEIRVC